jgi:hypothetical protein
VASVSSIRLAIILLLARVLSNHACAQVHQAQAGPQRAPAAHAGVQTLRYHGIRPTDPRGRDGIRNPDRGLRTETIIAEGKDDKWVARVRHYATHGVTLAQTYCYLTEFSSTDISPGKLAQLQSSFDALRANGLKAVLRFAYERDKSSPGPRLTDVRRHISQLKPLLVRNVDVICVVEAGLIGLWGEWHHSVHGLDKDVDAQRQIVMDLLDALPVERHVLFRRPRYKRAVLGEDTPWTTAATAHTGIPAARMGFHSDYFVVRRHGWDITPGTRDFEQALAEGPFLWMGGEMPWGSEVRRRGWQTDGFGAAVRMRDHHYSVFSLAHNFEEGRHEHDMKRWMKEPLTVQRVRGAKLPLSDGYFENAQGREVERCQFDYIRDHLGYRLELQEATFPKSVRRGESLECRLSLINRGFSAMHNPRPVYLVMVDDAARVVAQQLTATDPRRWQPYRPEDAEYVPLRHEIATSIRVSPKTTAGTYRLGLWLPDAQPSIQHDPRYAVRLANRDAPWAVSADGRYGVNVLGEMEVTK